MARDHVRLLVEPYRSDRTDLSELTAAFAALHALLGTRRTLALEVHLDRRVEGAPLAWFAAVCPSGIERAVEAVLRGAYPNLRLREVRAPAGEGLHGVRLVRRSPPRGEDEPPADGEGAEALLRAMAAAGPPATLRLVLRPASGLVERCFPAEMQPVGPLLWAEAQVLAADVARARAIASVLAAGPPRLMASRLRGAGRRLRRSPRRLFRPWELARLWSLPSPEFTGVPYVRRSVPLAPAPPGVPRAREEDGLVRDEHGPVTIPEAMRRQHVAVVGAVDQGKTSFLVASTRADLRRSGCAVIVLDPKGDAANAVLSVVPRERRCTLLDMSAPTAGFNPLAVDGAPDAIADHVVAALRGLFADGEVRGSSDRYLRNALIAVLACSRDATLWDVARLLEVGDAGRSLRARVAERLETMPAYAELAVFLAEELPTQLADARASTTAKLDAPANKLARILNSPAVKRVLLNDSLPIDVDGIVARGEVLVVRGALGEVGAGNVAVLMQLLVGMLDAALGRVQDRQPSERRSTVALKIDEAPLVINAAFAQTLALKRSAGLETVACWQTDAQWEPELRDQLDALFAHRVLFATASAADARAASALLMSEYSDQVRAGDEQLARLASPDVRLHLPRHTALLSVTTPRGRERPFIAATLPLPLDRERIGWHAQAQRERGGRELGEPGPPPIAPGLESPSLVVALPPPAVQLPATAPQDVTEAQRELLALDCADRVRWLPVRAARGRPAIDDADRDLLRWLAGARCALTTQIARRANPGRSLTTTQRQLKRLAEAGLIARFQLHRDDGGGLPHCCVVTDAAIAELELSGRRAPRLGEAELTRLRRDVHVVGWLLALEAHCGGAVVEVLGPGRAVIRPPSPDARALALPDGLRPRDLVTIDDRGHPTPAERFATVRPDAVVDLGVRDLVVVRGGATSLLVALDHLLSGWWRDVARFRRRGEPPLAVVLCEGEERALECAALADAVLLAAVGRVGVPAQRWERPGRAGIRFAVEGDLYRGSLDALRVAPLPPQLRAGAGEPERCPIVQLPPGIADPGAPPPWR